MCAVALCVCVGMRQAECMVSEFNITLSSFLCLSVCARNRNGKARSVAEPWRSSNVGPRRRRLSAINLGNQTKRAEKEKFSS